MHIWIGGRDDKVTENEGSEKYCFARKFYAYLFSYCGRKGAGINIYYLGCHKFLCCFYVTSMYICIHKLQFLRNHGCFWNAKKFDIDQTNKISVLMF